MYSLYHAYNYIDVFQVLYLHITSIHLYIMYIFICIYHILYQYLSMIHYESYIISMQYKYVVSMYYLCSLSLCIILYHIQTSYLHIIIHPPRRSMLFQCVKQILQQDRKLIGAAGHRSHGTATPLTDFLFFSESQCWSYSWDFHTKILVIPLIKSSSPSGKALKQGQAPGMKTKKKQH